MMKRIFLLAALLAVSALLLPALFSGNAQGEPPPQSVSEEQTPVAGPTVQQTAKPTAERDKNTVLRLIRSDGSVETLNMHDYLTGVVAAEMPASFSGEALKAQAVAARSYTLYKMLVASNAHENADVCDDSGCCKAYADPAVLKDKWGESYEAWYAKVRDAVEATDGQYLSYAEEPILAVFHSSSCGRTENSENVWSSALPYLKSVESAEKAENVPNYISTVTLSAAELKSALISLTGTDITETAEEIFEALEYSDTGRVTSLILNGERFTGTQLRQAFGLRSAAFTAETTEDGGAVFTVQGYGHGVGMSQYGAEELALDGMGYEEILLWYYTGVTLISAEG